MKLQIVAVGRPRAEWAKAAWEHYQKFLRKYGGVDFQFVPAIKITGGADPTEIRTRETKRLLTAVPERASRIFVDQSGQSFNSPGWAKNLQRARQKAAGPLVFLIGGPLGLDLAQKHPRDEVWSLSQLTLPHELALIVLAEQLARGLSILRGDNYHN